MRDKSKVLGLLSPRRISLVYLLVGIVAVFSLVNPELFLSEITIQSVLRSQAVVGILAIGLLLPFIAGEFDISVGANMAMAVIIVAQLSKAESPLNPWVLCLIAILACTAAGVINGILVGVVGINSFIATLATGQVLLAIGLKLSDNNQVVAELPQDFMDLGQGQTLGLPNAVYITLALGLLVWYLLQFTVVGRHLFASGFNREAARLSGVRTKRLVVGSFVAAGAISGLAGVVFIAQLGTYSPSIGGPFLFPAFAAVFLGATQFNQRPNVWGTLLALFTLALGVLGLQLSVAESGFWITPLFNGLALVAAVIFTRRQAIRKATDVEPNASGGDSQPPDQAIADVSSEQKREVAGR